MLVTQLQPLPSCVGPILQEPTTWTTADIARVLRPLIAKFDSDVNYTGAKSGDDLEGLLSGMHEQAIKTGIPYPEGSRSWHSFKVGVYYAHVSKSVTLFNLVSFPSGRAASTFEIYFPLAYHFGTKTALLSQPPARSSCLHRRLYLARRLGRRPSLQGPEAMARFHGPLPDGPAASYAFGPSVG